MTTGAVSAAAFHQNLRALRRDYPAAPSMTALEALDEIAKWNPMRDKRRCELVAIVRAALDAVTGGEG